MEIYKTVRPRGGRSRLREVFIIGLNLTGNIFIEWLQMGGGRLREVVEHGGSTLVLLCEITI